MMLLWELISYIQTFIGYTSYKEVFLHDGSYYAQRNDIDVRFYPKRFKDDSTTSKAFFEFSYMERVAFALAGCIFFVGYIFLINI